jgi:hypothetical protein
VTGSIAVIVFLLTPLLCWALLARTKVLGWTFAVVFAAYAVAEGFLAPNWRFGGFRLWLLPGLAVMSAVALVIGPVLERRELGVPVRPWTARNVTGAILASLYGVVVIGGILLLLLVIGSEPDIGYPCSSAVLPLGPGLAVTQHHVGCGNGDYASCTTVFQVAYLIELDGGPPIDSTSC